MKIKEQIKKGCGKEINHSLNEYNEVVEIIRCGDRLLDVSLCSTCEAKLQAIESYEKEIIEMIGKLKKLPDKNPNDAQIFLIDNKLSDMVLSIRHKNRDIYASDAMFLFLSKKLESLEKEIRSGK